MAVTPIRLGVVGLGVMGRRTFEQALRHPAYVVARAADVSGEVVAMLAAAHPEVEFVAPEDVVRDVDAVYIATPPASHAEFALRAMRAGVAVFCEKPLAVSLTEGRRMVATAAETGAVTAVNFPLSDMDATLYVERATPELGRPLGVDVRLTFPLWPRPFQTPAEWVGERAQGGFVREVFSHFAYLTDRLVGPLRAVQAAVGYPADARRSEIAAHGLLRAGDVPVQVSGYAGVAATERYEWTLWGTRRSYQLRDWRQLFVSDGGEWTPVDVAGHGTGAGSTRLSLFAEAIGGRRPPNLADFADALRVQEAVEAFYT